jgi:hypothetical protein
MQASCLYHRRQSYRFLHSVVDNESEILNKIAKIDPLLSGLKLERGKTRADELNSSESLESKSDTMSSLPALLQVIPHE